MLPSFDLRPCVMNEKFNDNFELDKIRICLASHTTQHIVLNERFFGLQFAVWSTNFLHIPYVRQVMHGAYKESLSMFG